MYPVDLPAVDDTDLTSASEHYLSSLESRPPTNEWFPLSHTSKVAITTNNVRRLQLFEDDQSDCTLLALHPPDDPTQVVALYLHEKWWCVDDILLTCSKSRRGLISVQSIVERVIVFLLSQVVERSSQEKVLFSLHPRTENCKLLWRDSQAVAFYTIKHKGSRCDGWSSRCYLLPTLDTVLVRRSWRRRGFGLQMLKDFCSSFSTEKFLGVSSPLSPSMVAVCRSFLQQHEEHVDTLYEVEAPGGWTQRRNIWLSIQLGRYSVGISEESSPTSGDTQRNKGHDSSQKTYDCRLNPTSLSNSNGNIPLAIGSPVQKKKPCDPSRGGSSPSNKISATGCSPAAHADDLDSGPPSRPPQSLNKKQALKAKPSLQSLTER
ncbi:protein FAM169B [Cottoperca gobio]|uniref:Protein FAM169B-like n=1 Tax=Cottoperca gobio TaxID=56716 RepID=A0A6J2PXG3_COTGO|nr:protein FAM169B-like [Cottoperca gobio]XP_029290143.1 protein FAM169B-like [Cottoperca gobio]XP_029290144.1 protein FAM169B-like [Cottoperca gobio]